jgi:hypothetical protein
MNATSQPEKADDTRPRRPWFRRLVALLAVLALGYACRGYLLKAAANFLVIDESVEGTDVVLVPETRGCQLRAAGALLRASPALRALVIERPQGLTRLGLYPSEGTIARGHLSRHGVSVDRVTVLPSAGPTDWEALRAVRQWMEDHPRARLAILNGRFDNRRYRLLCRAVFEEKQLARVRLGAVPFEEYDETDWWRCKDGLKTLLCAYLRLAYVVLHGENSEEWRPWDPDRYEQSLR